MSCSCDKIFLPKHLKLLAHSSSYSSSWLQELKVAGCITSTVKKRERRNGRRLGFSLLYLLHSSGFPCLRHEATHSRQAFKLQLKEPRNSLTDMPTRKPNLDNPSLTFSSQMVLDPASWQLALPITTTQKRKLLFLAQRLKVQGQSQQGHRNMGLLTGDIMSTTTKLHEYCLIHFLLIFSLGLNNSQMPIKPFLGWQILL